jgi:hypothetical protein
VSNSADVTHHIPGRMRIKVPHAKGNHKLLEQIRQSVSAMPGVGAVEVNPVTGSILLHYDTEKHEAFESALGEHGEQQKLFTLTPPQLTEADEIAAKIQAEAEFLSEHSDVARSLVNFFKYVNESVKRASGNSVDLKVLLPLGLAAYMFTSSEAMMSTPMWVTLSIFSFNSFLALHHDQPQNPHPVHKVVFDDSIPLK